MWIRAGGPNNSVIFLDTTEVLSPILVNSDGTGTINFKTGARVTVTALAAAQVFYALQAQQNMQVPEANASNTSNKSNIALK